MRISDWSSDVCSSDLDIGRTAYAVKPDLAAAGSGDVRWPVAAALLDAQLLVGDHAIGQFRLVPAQAHALCGDRADRLLRRQQQPHLHGLVCRPGHAAGAVAEAPEKAGAHTPADHAAGFLGEHHFLHLAVAGRLIADDETRLAELQGVAT